MPESIEEKLLVAEDKLEELTKQRTALLDVLDDIDEMVKYNNLTTLSVRSRLDEAFKHLETLK